MADRIRLRRDTAANWTLANPVLLLGEAGWEYDTGKLKLGNGSSDWNSLVYAARSFIWKGVYSTELAYKSMDCVYFLGSTYVCTVDAAAGVDPTVFGNWDLMAAKGDDGIDGINGNNGTSFTWRGPYNSTTTYVVGNAVSFNGTAYICKVSSSVGTPPTNVANWDILAEKGSSGTAGTNGSSMVWRSAYDSIVSYSPLDVVSYQGSSYICILTALNKVPTNASYWALLASKGTDGTAGTNGIDGTNGLDGKSIIWRDAYSNTTSYVVNDAVSYNGSSYICKQNSAGNIPTNVTYWGLLSQKGDTGPAGSGGSGNGVSFIWRGSFLNGQTYAVNDVVSYNGSSYICVAASTSNLPTNVAFWNLMSLKGTDGTNGINGTNGNNGTSFIWKGAYSSSVTYIPNDVVTYSGSSYICISSAINVVPTTTAKWTLMASKGSDGASGGGSSIAEGKTTYWTATANQTTFNTITGYTTTNADAYFVSVGAQDQIPTLNYTITDNNGLGALVLSTGVPAGTKVVVRALAGGALSGNATSLQGRSLASTAPSDGQGVVWNEAIQSWEPKDIVSTGTNATQLQGQNVSAVAPTEGQVLTWNATTGTWEATTIDGSLGGTITFNTVGVHYFDVPISARWARLQALSGSGTNGTDGTDGTSGGSVTIYQEGYFDEFNNWVSIVLASGVSGNDGVDGVDGVDGKSVKIGVTTIATGGAKGLKGYGGGAGGGAGVNGCTDPYGYQIQGVPASNGNAGKGPNSGGGGSISISLGTKGSNGSDGGSGDGAAGGDGGLGAQPYSTSEGVGGNGGAASLATRAGGGGGAGGAGGMTDTTGYQYMFSASGGSGGKGGLGSNGEAGVSIDIPYDLTTYAGSQVLIEITEGAGDAFITLTW